MLRFQHFVENIYDSFTFLGREYFTFALVIASCYSVHLSRFCSSAILLTDF